MFTIYYNVTCLRTCLLLYWPKIHRIFVLFMLFWHWVSLFLFDHINIINVGYKKPQKKGGKGNVSATYGGSKTYLIACNSKWKSPVCQYGLEKYVEFTSYKQPDE